MDDIEQLKGNIARWQAEIAHQQAYIRRAVPAKRQCLSGPVGTRDPIAALEWQQGIVSARGIIRDRRRSIREARELLAKFRAMS